IPFRASSVPAWIRRSSSPAGRPSSTSAARRNAWTRYVGAPPRSSWNAICRNASTGSTRPSYPRSPAASQPGISRRVGHNTGVQVAMLGPLEVRADDSGAVLEVGGARLRDAVADPEPWVSVTALVMRGHVRVNYGRQHARAEEDFLAATRSEEHTS